MTRQETAKALETLKATCQAVDAQVAALGALVGLDGPFMDAVWRMQSAYTAEVAREVAGPGVCIVTLERPDEYDAADSSAACWDRSRPHMVQYSRPRLSGKRCGESLYMPDGQVQRWYGCPKWRATDTIR